MSRWRLGWGVVLRFVVLRFALKMPLTAADVDHIGVASKHTTNMRTLHWVTKIGSLKNSLRFYELVFGFRVLRHEEFESGCEATCNGPYGGAWSKTMVGLGNENCNFGARDAFLESFLHTTTGHRA